MNNAVTAGWQLLLKLVKNSDKFKSYCTLSAGYSLIVEVSNVTVMQGLLPGGYSGTSGEILSR